MILLFANAALADTVTVCNSPGFCDHLSLDAAFGALAAEQGPHTIEVTGVHALLQSRALAQDYTLVTTNNASISVAETVALTVNTGRVLEVEGFTFQFPGNRSARLFDVNGTFTGTDLIFGDIITSQSGALVHVNSGTATLVGSSIQPTLASSFGSGSAFYVGSSGTIELVDLGVDGVLLSGGHVFDVSGGSVTGSGLVVEDLFSDDRGALGRIHGGGSFELDGGQLGVSSTLLPAISAANDGGLFRVEGSTLRLENTSIANVVAGSGGVAWANGASDIDFVNVELSGIDAEEGSILRLDGGTFDWVGGSAADIVTGTGGALTLDAGTVSIDTVLFDTLVGTDGPAITESAADLELLGVDVVTPTSFDAAVHALGDLTVIDAGFSGGSGAESAHIWAEGAALLDISDTEFTHGACSGPGDTPGANALVLDGRDGALSSVRFTANGSPTAPCSGTLLVDGEVTLSNTAFENNASALVGAIQVEDGGSVLQGAERNEIVGNDGDDAAIYGRQNAVLGTVHTPFWGRFASNLGGAIRFDANTAVHLVDSTFESNDSENSAGGAIRMGTGSTLIVADSAFSNNQSTGGIGGAIAAEGGAVLEIRGSDFFENTAEFSAGAVFSSVDGALVETSTFIGNRSVTSHGGAVYFGAGLDVLDSVFRGNQAGDYGGAIGGQASSSLFVNGTEIRDNTAGGNAAGIYMGNGSTLETVDSVFTNNQSSGNRGAILVNLGGTMSVERSLFCGNTSLTHGAAIMGNQLVGGSIQHTWFASHDETPVFLHGLDGHFHLTQSTFAGPGTAVRISDGDENVDVLVERSLFSGLEAGDRPVEMTDFDPPDAAVFEYSMLHGPGYLEPSGPNVTVTGLVDEDPQLVAPAVDCATITREDLVAGPLSLAWTRANDPFDHWGAYLPAWGENHDQDASPAYWDCSDGDQDDDDLIHREAAEVCGDSIDQDCDGFADEGCQVLYYPDVDGDSFGDADNPGSIQPWPHWVQDNSDCDDADPSVSPVASEICNGIDDNCDGQEDEGFPYADIIVDVDGDLHGVVASGCPNTGLAIPADDCDDTNAGIHPGAAEVCGNHIDENCVDGADETSPWFPDDDSDGYGDADHGVDACEPPSGHVADSSDCDDTNAAVHPGAHETCNDLDDDCAGGIDDGLPELTSYLDHDQDGFARNDSEALVDCEIPATHTVDLGDCDDHDATTYTGAQELCDTVDHDCDGDPNPVGTPTWYPDVDGDGYGAGQGTENCVQPPDTAGNATDCNDADELVNPGAHEVCDGIDNDCAGGIDDGLPVLDWYTDADADGYGAGAAVSVCDGLQDPSRVAQDGDCDDQNPQLSPGADEICDQIDNDCDLNVDDQDDDVVGASVYYLFDEDGDGWGAITAGPSCAVPPGALNLGPDCDDHNPIVYPEAPENCVDGVDNDCDMLVDLDDPDFVDGAQVYWADADGDGFGDPHTAVEQCGLQPGYVLAGLQLPDCDDGRSDVNPFAAEVCDNVDNDCDMLVDGADTNPPPSDGYLLYADGDVDGFGAALLLERACDTSQIPTGTSTIGGDCDDGEATVFPAAIEDCSAVDRDCSGDPFDGEEVHYADADGDGFGDPLLETVGCFPNDPSWIQVAGDCDDSSDQIYPGAPELCDAVDQDCDGEAYEGDPLEWRVDRDCDEVPGEVVAACNPADIPDLGACDPVLHDGSELVEDCDDTDPDVTVCESEPLPKRVVATGCGCDSSGTGGWLGLLVLLYGVRKRRTGGERLVG